MKLDALTERLINGIPPVLREGTVTRDELGDRPTHHSVTRITGVKGMTRDRLLQVIESVLGVQMSTLHSDADSHTLEIAGRSGARICARVYKETSEATIATYAGPETRFMDDSGSRRDTILRIHPAG